MQLPKEWDSSLWATVRGREGRSRLGGRIPEIES